MLLDERVVQFAEVALGLLGHALVQRKLALLKVNQKVKKAQRHVVHSLAVEGSRVVRLDQVAHREDVVGFCEGVGYYFAAVLLECGVVGGICQQALGFKHHLGHCQLFACVFYAAVAQEVLYIAWRLLSDVLLELLLHGFEGRGLGENRVLGVCYGVVLVVVDLGKGLPVRVLVVLFEPVQHLI